MVYLPDDTGKLHGLAYAKAHLVLSVKTGRQGPKKFFAGPGWRNGKLSGLTAKLLSLERWRPCWRGIFQPIDGFDRALVDFDGFVIKGSRTSVLLVFHERGLSDYGRRARVHCNQ